MKSRIFPLKLIHLLPLCIMAFTSCSGAVDYYFKYTRTQPSKDHLVGAWSPDKATIEDMNIRGGYNSEVSTKLILERDGKFKLINMPDWWTNGFGESRKSFESDVGTWEISQQVESTIWVIELQTANRFMIANLIGQSSPYSIRFNLGDPDLGEYMTFVKQ